MSRFKRCLSVINTRSGAREGLSVFASALQQYLDKAGITHHDVCVPEKDILHALNMHAGTADVIAVCGGDGTISSAVNAIAATPGRPFITVPIVPVPCGLQNSIATSLGVYSAERSVSAFVVGRLEPVPLWEVRVDGRLTRYVVSYVAVGAYAMCVRRLHELDALGENYMALPTVRGNYKAGAFYTAMRNELVPCGFTMKTETTTTTTATKSVESNVKVQEPIKLLIAAQMPLQHRHYTLTPNATYKHDRLGVTYATAEATRLRLWHLLSREAAEGVILNEDGVCECLGVSELDFTIQETAGEGDAQSSVVMLLDGEPVRLAPGANVSVRRAPCHVLFAAC